MPPEKLTSTESPAAAGELVLGLGGTVDYELTWDSAVLEDLIGRHRIHAAELDPWIPITTERELVVALLGFFHTGRGGERFADTADILEMFAARFAKRITLGGTCVRAALAMDRLGLASTLHLVSINDHVRRLLPAGCRYICSATGSSVDPHVIVQFEAGATVRAGDIDLRAPHPNRVILVNDPPNREMIISPELGPVLRRAAVFLISGLNTMRDPALVSSRIEQITADARGMPAGSVIVYEDGGFHDPALNHLVRAGLGDIVDVFSMNEDEMQLYLGRSVELLDVDDAAKALDELHSLIPVSTVVVHTKYWSIALTPEPSRWTAALLGGITMASTRFCHGDDFTVEDYRRVGRLPANLQGAAVASAIGDRLAGPSVCLPAFAVNVSHPTTIGLGDSFVGGFLSALATRS